MFGTALTFVTGNLAALATGAGAAAIIALAMKQIPKLIDREIGGFLDKQLLDLKNLDDQRFALELVRWIEKKVPDKGQGGKKYKLASEFIVRVLPIFKGQKDKIRELIETVVVSMNKELKERAAKD